MPVVYIISKRLNHHSRHYPEVANKIASSIVSWRSNMKFVLVLHGLLVCNIWLSFRVATLDSVRATGTKRGPSEDRLAGGSEGHATTSPTGIRTSSTGAPAALIASTELSASSTEPLATHVSVSCPTAVLDLATETNALPVPTLEPTTMYNSATERTANLVLVSEITAMLDSSTKNRETTVTPVSVSTTIVLLVSATETLDISDSFGSSAITPTDVMHAYAANSKETSLSESTVILTSGSDVNLLTDRKYHSSDNTTRSITFSNHTIDVITTDVLTNSSSSDTVSGNSDSTDLVPQIEDTNEFYYEEQGDESEKNYTLAYQVEACGRHCRNGSTVWSAPLEFSPFRCSSCYCDNLCTSYGDCCPDENGTVPTPNSDVTYVCIRPGPNGFTDTLYYMIKWCPSNATNVTSVVSDELYPVTSVRTRQTYFNEAFAACNNDTDFVHWLNVTKCSDIVLNSEDDDEDEDDMTPDGTTQEREVSECYASFIPAPESVTHRPCSWHKTVDSERIVYKCNSSGILSNVDPVLQTLCQSNEYLVDSYDRVYKNVFCYLCNTISVMPGGGGGFQQDAPVSLSDLTSFRNVHGGSNPGGDEAKVTCAENEWSDPVTKRCRNLNCAAGRHLEVGNCALDDLDILNVEYYALLQFTFTKNISGVKNWTDVVTMFRNRIPEILSAFDALVYSFHVEELIYPESDPDEETDYNVGIYIEFRSRRNDSRSEYESCLLNKTWSEWVFHHNDIVTVLQPEQYDYRTYPDNWHIFTFDPLARICCSDEAYGTWLFRLSELFDWFPHNPDMRIPLHSPVCAYITLDEREFTISPDRSLRLFSGNATLRKGEYFHAYYKIHVCLHTLLLALNDEDNIEEYVNETSNNMLRIQGYLSLVCTCISLICLLLTLITFFTFSALRSLPNKNTMFLAMSLFVAQAAFQFGAGGTGNKMACQIIGVAIHFLWLTVVFWMNICCFHMFRVFASSAKGRVAHSVHWKTLLKYAFYVYGFASAIVSATVGANYAISNGTSIGYGERLCYISDPMVNGLAFVLPLGITIAVNTFLFAFTICTISKISKIEKTSSPDRRNMFVYIKLSTLTGVFWGLAILAEVTAISALSYISIVLNGCQGAFIFMSYVANRRVYRMWRRVCHQPRADLTGSRSSQYTESSRL